MERKIETPRIKFCGFTRPMDLRLAVDLGIDAVGLVVAYGSPRQLSWEKAEELLDLIPEKVCRVVVVYGDQHQLIEKAATHPRVDIIQIHRWKDIFELPCRPGLHYWLAAHSALQKALEVHRAFETREDVAALVWDSSAGGGSGVKSNWRAIMSLPRTIPLVLAGGLEPANIAVAIRQVRPDWVDCSSGIESKPGIKSAAKMKKTVEAIHAILN